jgi:glycosyltransferase involved in cell wall biosynthesis
VKVLFLANNYLVLFNFRKELILKFLNDGNEVFISCPEHPNISFFTNKGIKFIKTNFSRRTINILNEIKLLFFYKKIFKYLNPDYVFSFTIKPNILGGIASKNLKLKFVPNITGLGNSFLSNFIYKFLAIILYKYSFSKIHHIFFQNKSNYNFFLTNQIIKSNTNFTLLPGSGVNLHEFKYQPLENTKTIRFLYCSRIMKEKGIDFFIEAATILKNKYSNLEFKVVGFCEEDYTKILNRHSTNNVLTYEGFQENVYKYYVWSSCLVFPSYYPEGISNVLLEAAAVGRALITTDHPGCKETVINGFNGYLIKPMSLSELLTAMIKFIELSSFEKIKLGQNSREYVSQNFSRNIVINEYAKIIQ